MLLFMPPHTPRSEMWKLVGRFVNWAAFVISMVILEVTFCSLFLNLWCVTIPLGKSQLDFCFQQEEQLRIYYCKATTIYAGPKHPSIHDPQYRAAEDPQMYDAAVAEYEKQLKVWQAGVPRPVSYRWWDFDIGKFAWYDLNAKNQSVVQGMVYEIWIPTIVLLFLSGILPGRALIRLVRKDRLRRRPKEQRCLSCGYDVRVNSGRCPECGAAVVGTAEKLHKGA